MKYMNKSKSKLIKFLNGKAFYVVAGICFVAIGVAAWTGLEGLNRSNAEGPQKTSSVESTTDHGNQVLEVVPPIKLESESTISENAAQNKDTQSVIESVVSELPETEETAAPVASFFVNPVMGDIIKDFSDTELQYSMTMCDMRLHKGVDIAADEGTPVIAAGEGTVKAVGIDSMLGTVVEIDHGNGITAKYCGLNDSLSVKPGDVVDSSKQLGVVGIIPSESVEQRHLHLEFYKDGKAVLPTKYIVQQ